MPCVFVVRALPRVLLWALPQCCSNKSPVTEFACVKQFAAARAKLLISFGWIIVWLRVLQKQYAAARANFVISFGCIY